MSIKYNGLFDILRKRGISKTQLKNRLKLSSTTLAKLSKNEPVSMKVVEDICRELSCQPGDIMVMEKEEPENVLLMMLQDEKDMELKGGIYHQTQIKLAYNSNRIEGSRLTEEQTRYIYETNTIAIDKDEPTHVDDIIETMNHFLCFDYMLGHVEDTLTELIIKEFHRCLKNSTSDSRKEWFNIGDYKTQPNMIGDKKTTPPSKVRTEMVKLLDSYNDKKSITLNDIIEFHYRFESIHPFQDGNGRVGRLIMFKECLKHNITPFIIDETHKLYYYRGLNDYEQEKGYLTDTCLSAQDKYVEFVNYFIGKEKS